MAKEIEIKYQTNKVIEVVNPPVKYSNFYVSDTSEGYYLVVLRLEYYKKVDIVIDAFNELGLPLIIVGSGSKENELKVRAKSNVIFKKGLSNEEIAKLYSKANAFIFPQKEDYGITPLEANASGIPVIAYGQGGVLETMIPHNGANANQSTAVFFHQQTADSLVEAIIKTQTISFDKRFIRAHAEKFAEKYFMEKIDRLIHSKYNHA